MPDEPFQLWFPIVDVLPLAEDSMQAPALEPDPRHGTQPVLQLTSQGDLFYLTGNGWPPPLVDAFDPGSRQRVYAIGYSYHISGMSMPADERHGTPKTLGSIPLTDRHASTSRALIEQLRGADRLGCEWLVLSLTAEGPLRCGLHPFPHPAPAAAWRDVDLELVGVPGRWPGQILTNATFQGWLVPRFAADVAAQIAAVLDEPGPLPRPVTRIRLSKAADRPDCPVGGDVDVVGVDADGYHRVGPGWPWVSLDLLPDGRLVPYLDPPPAGIDPAGLPDYGQDTYTGLGCLMWLDEDADMVVRPVYDNGLDALDEPGPPEYGNLDPDAEWQFRAAEHLLRRAAASRVVVTGLAAAFSPADIETLVITAADAVVAGLDTLGSRQLELAAHAYALIDDIQAEPLDGNGDRDDHRDEGGDGRSAGGADGRDAAGGRS